MQRLLRREKTSQIHAICENVQRNSVSNSTKEHYQGVRKLAKKLRPNIDTIKSDDGNVLSEAKDLTNRWQEYCSNLYKKNVTVTAPPFPTDHPCPEEPLSLISEVREAINLLKLNESPGCDITFRKNF